MFDKIIEEKWIWKYLVKRNILKHYLKAKQFMLLWNLRQVDFKIRKPKINKIYYFKINEKYRVYCYFDNRVLKIFRISDHQD